MNRFRLVGLFLLLLLFVAGFGRIHEYVHLASEEDSPTHDPETCPVCQTLEVIASTTPEPSVDGGTPGLDERGSVPTSIEAGLATTAVSRPAARAPPAPAAV